MKRLTIDLPDELHQKIKFVAVHGEVSMRDLVIGMLQRYVDAREAKPQNFVHVGTRTWRPLMRPRKPPSKDLILNIWAKLSTVTRLIEEYVIGKTRRDEMTKLLAQATDELAALKLVSQEEVWDFIEHTTWCPYFDTIGKDDSETFLEYACLPEQEKGAGPLGPGKIRTKTFREAIEQFAKAMGIPLPQS